MHVGIVKNVKVGYIKKGGVIMMTYRFADSENFFSHLEFENWKFDKLWKTDLTNPHTKNFSKMPTEKIGQNFGFIIFFSTLEIDGFKCRSEN